MWEIILGIISSGLTLISEWPKRQAEKAQKNYANWRASVDIKKERRSRTAGDLVRSADELLRKKGKLPGK